MSQVRGGDAFRSVLGAISKQLSGGSVVRIGFLANATYADGKPVAMIAAIQEFGTGHIPSRPFFRNMIRRKKGEWPSGIATQLRLTDYNIPLTLERTGQAISGQLRESIIETNAPPLAPSTIVRKGGTRGMKYDAKDPSTYPAKPLVDTGHMLGSVDYELKT